MNAQTDRKKIRIPGEVAYLLGLILMSLAVSMTAAADFGVSMIVAPAYLVSLKVSWLTFGQAEYLLQGILFVLFCILMRRIRLIYFVSFLTCLLYGLILDLWRKGIPILNPTVTAPGSMAMPVRIVFLAVGMVITSLAVALFFHVYLYPQVYDFFVKGLTVRYRLRVTVFKTVFDFSMLAISVILSWVLFHGWKGIGIGTLVMTVCNGTLIGWFDRMFGRWFDFTPLLPNLAGRFDF